METTFEEVSVQTIEPVTAPPLPLAEFVVTRRLSSRRPVAFLSWALVGALGTYVDGIHERLGVVAYPNHEWIGERLPVSPVYMMATVGFFILYTAVVGHRGIRQGIFGGRKLSGIDLGYAMGSWILAYCVSGFLGAAGGWPLAGAALLALWAFPTLWKARRTKLPIFAFLVAVLGTTFEWSATSQGMFVYPVCPAPICMGATVPMGWLFILYLHAAIFVHRLLGGRHLFSRPLGRP
jgi:hypothetical protein